MEFKKINEDLYNKLKLAFKEIRTKRIGARLNVPALTKSEELRVLKELYPTDEHWIGAIYTEINSSTNGIDSCTIRIRKYENKIQIAHFVARIKSVLKKFGIGYMWFKKQNDIRVWLKEA